MTVASSENHLLKFQEKVLDELRTDFKKIKLSGHHLNETEAEVQFFKAI